MTDKTVTSFDVGQRVKIADTCRWISLRGEEGMIARIVDARPGFEIYAVDFGGGCFDLCAGDFA